MLMHPISHTFDQAMHCLAVQDERPHLAVALSGGADSMAACLLSNAWVKERGGTLTALTVDHGLRPESAEEAGQVAWWMQEQHIAHHIFSWEADKPKSGMQEAAREVRYALMSEWCQRHAVHSLITGHHQDDQLETFWLRLVRGSGPFGLAGMSAKAQRHGITLLRPLLDTPKAQLIEWLQAQGHTWVEDASNQSNAYTRNRMRKLLEEERLDRTRTLQTIRSMQRARMAEEVRLAQAIDHCVILHSEGYAIIDPDLFNALSVETALRLLGRVLAAVGGMTSPARMAEVEAVYNALTVHQGGGDMKPRTLAGCIIGSEKKQGILVSREPARMQENVMAEMAGLVRWDGRYVLEFADDAPGRRITSLFAIEDTWRKIRQEKAVRQALQKLPARIVPTLPVITSLEDAIIIPHIGYGVIGGTMATWSPTHPLQAAGFCTLEPIRHGG